MNELEKLINYLYKFYVEFTMIKKRKLRYSPQEFKKEVIQEMRAKIITYGLPEKPFEDDNEQFNKMTKYAMELSKKNLFDRNISMYYFLYNVNVNREVKPFVKIYIGSNGMDYITLVEEINKFIIDNSELCGECKMRIYPSNDCIVLRSDNVEIIEKVNEFIEHNTKINKDSLIFNPLVPRKENLMVVYDINGGSYNEFLATTLISYFEKAIKEEKTVNINDFYEYVNNMEKTDEDIQYYQTLLAILKGDNVDNILKNTLFNIDELIKKIETKFKNIDITHYNTKEEFEFDIDNWLNTTLKELKIEKLPEILIINFNGKKEVVEGLIIKKQKKTILEILEKNESEEEKIINIENFLNYLTNDNILKKFYYSLKTYEHILKTEEISKKMFLYLKNELDEKDACYNLFFHLHSLYSDDYDLTIKPEKIPTNANKKRKSSLLDDYQEEIQWGLPDESEEIPIESKKKGNIEDFLIKISNLSTFDILKDTISYSGGLTLKEYETEKAKIK